MKRFFFLTVAYFCMSVGVVLLTRQNGLAALQSVGLKSADIMAVMVPVVIGAIALGVILISITKVGVISAVFRTVLLAFAGTILLQAGFYLFKTSMPYIVPFYADVALANWDRALHGGVDPWHLTHIWAGSLPMDALIPFYLHVWVWPAICLPILLAATDRNTARVNRTMVLYCLGWVLIGNVMALAGMSAGPVFYDRIYGGDTFASLTASIAQTPELADYFGLIQDGLWVAYTDRDQSIGFGISAFPSVHVSMSMVAALYLYDRSRLLGVLGAGFVLVILFLSIYSGYHYALDGYVSIAVIWGAWAWMRRRATAPRAVALPIGQLA